MPGSNESHGTYRSALPALRFPAREFTAEFWRIWLHPARAAGHKNPAKLLFPSLAFVCQDWGCPARRRLRFPSWRSDLSRSTLYPRVTLTIGASAAVSAWNKDGRPCGLRSLTIRLTDPKQEGGDPVRIHEFGKESRPPTLHWHTVIHWQTVTRVTFDSWKSW